MLKCRLAWPIDPLWGLEGDWIKMGKWNLLTGKTWATEEVVCC
jgi:hypothetical protein